MKTIITTRHLGRPAHRNRSREESVNTPHPGERLARDLGIKVHHLAERVHAGIGAAGAGRGQCALTELCQRLLQAVLHSLPMGLSLPALPRRTVVLKAECDASQVA